jgi:tRNA threonylcarbamoyladenosine biosynthesis protein TsaE
MSQIYRSRSEADTYDSGRRLAERLRAPAVVLLSGPLGVGKTVFTRGFASGLGADADAVVHSPSFSLVNVYPTPAGPLYHVDLYRLETSRDLHSIGLEEILASDSFVVIEWADKLALPIPGSISVVIESDPPTGRRIEITGAE